MTKQEIKYGYIFENDNSWKVLPEGRGVVVIGLGTRGHISHGFSWDVKSEEGEENLRKNLAAARLNHGENAFLVTRQEGLLVWRSEMEKSLLPKKVATVLPLLRREWPVFSENNGDIVA